MRRIRSIAGLAVLLALAGGCTSGHPAADKPGGGPGASVKASPTGLAATLGAFTLGSYRFKVTAKEGVYQGGIDPIADLLDSSIQVSSGGASLKIDTIQVRGSAYTRLGGLPAPGFDGATWYRIDRARVTKPGALRLSAIKAPTGLLALVAATSDVKRDGRAYRGTADMTRVVAWGPANVAQAGRTVPFEALLDER